MAFFNQFPLIFFLVLELDIDVVNKTT